MLLAFLVRPKHSILCNNNSEHSILVFFQSSIANRPTHACPDSSEDWRKETVNRRENDWRLYYAYRIISVRFSLFLSSLCSVQECSNCDKSTERNKEYWAFTHKIIFFFSFVHSFVFLLLSCLLRFVEFIRSSKHETHIHISLAFVHVSTDPTPTSTRAHNMYLHLLIIMAHCWSCSTCTVYMRLCVPVVGFIFRFCFFTFFFFSTFSFISNCATAKLVLWGKTIPNTMRQRMSACPWMEHTSLSICWMKLLLFFGRCRSFFRRPFSEDLNLFFSFSLPQRKQSALYQ